MRKTVFSLLLAALLVGAAFAQQIQVFSGPPNERASTRIFFWNGEAQQPAGQFAINFGQPEWKAEYATGLDDNTKGKYWRLGKDFWTTLDTQLPITIGGTEIPVGAYFLAVQRSSDGESWHLALIDPMGARKMKLDAFEVSTPRMPESLVKIKAPLNFSERTQTASKLAIQLQNDAEDMTKATLTIAWGQFELSAPVTVKLGD